MKAISLAATALAVVAGSALADQPAPAASGCMFGAGQTASAAPLLPPAVEERVAELRRHGDRFDAAIRQIETEAAKPGWGWEPCEQSGDTVLALSPDR